MADAYLFQGDLYCHACGGDLQTALEPDEDSERFPQGPYADGGGEADCPQHCVECGAFLENPLSEEGYSYLNREFYLKNANAELLRTWRKFYGVKAQRRKNVLWPSAIVARLAGSLESILKRSTTPYPRRKARPKPPRLVPRMDELILQNRFETS